MGKNDSPYYNPKEFRGSKAKYISDSFSDNEASSPLLSAICIIAVLLGLGYFAGKSYLSKYGYKSAPQIMGSMTQPKALPTKTSLQLDAQKVPINGHVNSFQEMPANSSFAPFRVIGDQNGNHCVFRLEEWLTGRPVLDLFVHNGRSAQTNVPLGAYRGSIACGNTWYGPQLFGPQLPLIKFSNPIELTTNRYGEPIGIQINLSKDTIGHIPTITAVKYMYNYYYISKIQPTQRLDTRDQK